MSNMSSGIQGQRAALQEKYAADISCGTTASRPPSRSGTAAELVGALEAVLQRLRESTNRTHRLADNMFGEIPECVSKSADAPRQYSGAFGQVEEMIFAISDRINQLDNGINRLERLG